jgi:hypothetical protein
LSGAWFLLLVARDERNLIINQAARAAVALTRITPMHQRKRAIFVLDVPDEADLAFEADSLAQAEEYARAPWFVRSVGQFFSHQGRGCETAFASQTRPASEAEAAVYRTLADEFAETAGCFFVAYLDANM